MGRIVRVVILAILVLAAQPVAPEGRAQEPPPPPDVNAQQVMVLSDFNEVLYEVRGYERTPPASLTKLMTAIVAVLYSDLNTVVTIEDQDLVGEATMGLMLGDQVTIGDLLYGLCLPSGNDAAMAIARGVGISMGAPDGEAALQLFIDLMNQTARELQLHDTHFMNPHGLDQEGHYSTPYDIALLLRAALNFPEIRERLQTPAIRVADKYDLYNGNQLLKDRADYVGGKTGLTDGCGFCLAAAARNGNGRMVIAVVMQDDWSWFWDVSLLLDYGYELAEMRGVPDWADPNLVGTQLGQRRQSSVVASPPTTAPGS